MKGSWTQGRGGEVKWGGGVEGDGEIQGRRGSGVGWGGVGCGTGEGGRGEGLVQNIEGTLRL